jgi:hypothetical protein
MEAHCSPRSHAPPIVHGQPSAPIGQRRPVSTQNPDRHESPGSHASSGVHAHPSDPTGHGPSLPPVSSATVVAGAAVVASPVASASELDEAVVSEPEPPSLGDELSPGAGVASVVPTGSSGSTPEQAASTSANTRDVRTTTGKLARAPQRGRALTEAR